MAHLRSPEPSHDHPGFYSSRRICVPHIRGDHGDMNADDYDSVAKPLLILDPETAGFAAGKDCE